MSFHISVFSRLSNPDVAEEIGFETLEALESWVTDTPIPVSCSEDCKAIQQAGGPKCPEKLRLPLWAPRTFRGRYRTAGNGNPSKLLVFDLDNVSPNKLDEIFDALQGIRFFAHTTHSHVTSSHECWRLVVETTAGIAPKEATVQAHTAFAKKFGFFEQCDKTCFNTDKAFFCTSARPGGRIERGPEIAGAAFDVSALAAEPVTPAPQESLVSRVDLGDARRKILGHVYARSSAATGEPYTVMVRNLLGGKPALLNENGEERDGRNNSLFSLAMSIAHLELPHDTVMALFSPGLSTMELEGGTYVEKFSDFYRRAIEKIAAKKAAAKAEVAEVRKSEATSGAVGAKFPVDANGRYTQDALAKLAEYAHCTLDELQKRWIVEESNGRVYVLSCDGYVLVTGDTPRIARVARRLLAPAPVELETEDGKPCRYEQLVERYGTEALGETTVDMTVTDTFFADETQSMVVGKGPPVFAPVYSERVERFLNALDDDKSTLKNYVLRLWEVNRPLPVLIFRGYSGAGKTLLSNCIASCFGRNGAGRIERLTGNFSDALTLSSFLIADEKLKPEVELCGLIKTYIGNCMHQVTAKHVPPYNVRVHPRMMITVNELSGIGCVRIDGPDSLQALSSRVCVLETPRLSPGQRPMAKVLALESSYDDVEKMASHGEFARHVAWMREQWFLTPEYHAEQRKAAEERYSLWPLAEGHLLELCLLSPHFAMTGAAITSALSDAQSLAMLREQGRVAVTVDGVRLHSTFCKPDVYRAAAGEKYHIPVAFRTGNAVLSVFGAFVGGSRYNLLPWHRLQLMADRLSLDLPPIVTRGLAGELTAADMTGNATV